MWIQFEKRACATEQLAWVAILFLSISVSPVWCQTHGVPPSVTSIATPSAFFAPAPSITSLGPLGWQVPPSLLPGAPFVPGWGPGDSFPWIPNRVRFPSTIAPGFTPGGIGRQEGDAQSGVVPIVVPYAYPIAFPMPVGDVAPMATEEAQPVPPSIATATQFAGNQRVVQAPPTTQIVTAEPEIPPFEQKTTILIFRNGKRIEVKNYAIIGDKLVNFSGSPRHILLNELDLSATSEINEERAVSFHLPAERNGLSSAAR